MHRVRFPNMTADEGPVVGFVGLGAMGSGMAKVLLRGGMVVKGFDVWDVALARFAEAGGRAVTSLADCAAGVDALVLMVVNAEQADSVLFAEDGALATLPQGAVVILCATVPPAYAEGLSGRLEASGHLFVDAPVSGGTVRAADGALTIMSSGTEAALAKASPMLKAMTGNGGKLYCISGGAGMGSNVKMVNQLLAGVHIAAAAEAMALGARVGLDTAELFQIISNAAGASWMFCDRVPRMLAGAEDNPRSALDIFVKDLGIVLSEGLRTKFPLPITASAHQLFLQGSAMGLGKKDDSAVVKCYPGVTVARHVADSSEQRAKSEVLGSLPPVRPLTEEEVVQCRHLAKRHFLVVLDDDPTGTQTMHDVAVLLEWGVELLAQTFRSLKRGGTPGFFVMTNSRALGRADAEALIREVCGNLQSAAAQESVSFSVVLRSDSTLRGHFPLENDVAEDVLGPFDLWILCPFFFQGGRLTVDDVHYVADGEALVPAASTPFAQDQAFGYRSSNLRHYVQEKTGGRVKAEDVHAISIDLIRTRGPQGVARFLHGLPRGAVCVVNAAAEEDLHVFALGLRSFEMHDPSKPRSVLCRTAASFVSSCLLPGEGPRPPVGPTQGPPDASRGTRGGILVCGSYVPKTTAQIASLLARTAKDRLPLEVVQVEASLLADGDASPGRVGEITRAAAACDRALQEGRSALVYTSRALVRGRDEGDAITVQARVASGLVEVVRSVATRPAFLISKGGITSADMARRAMGAQSALVLGQAAPGVPLWSLQGPCVRFPGLPLVVFPGNVGGDDTLADVAQRWLQPCVRPGFKELLRNARNQGYAIGAFNVYDLNGAAAVVSTAEEARAPVILQVHPGSLKSKMGGAALVSGLKALAGQAAVPVLVHLDHAGEEEWPRALELGMDSVMADGSDLGDDANAEMTASAVEAARARGMGTEAELGRLTGTEDGVTVEVSERGPEVRILAGAMRTSLLIADSRCETQEYLAKLTDPSQACAFVKRTRCDALAVCVGNVHGKYPPSGPRIDLDRLLAISHAMAAMGESRAELVLHGASGLPRETVEACIRAGVAKFNVNTELRAAYVRALGEEGELVPVMEHANAAMRVVVREKLELFGCVGRV